ncbi:MAG TPA: biopolymer transporter ExbD [Terriglobales bacterium]|jgi:biopolymer transport protein TolR|nr:biopolymer transporter ExbD [Terriglobales bacterium]
MAFSPGGKNTAEINVTPLIDVLLVLLVTFLLIVPVTPKGEEARIPQDSKQPATDQESAVVLQLTATASADVIQLAINKQKLEWSTLEGTLRQIFKSRGNKTFFVAGDREIDFSSIARAIDMAHAAGVENVGLMKSRED